MNKLFAHLQVASLTALGLMLASQAAFGSYTQSDVIRQKTENQVRNMVQPILDRYCSDQCKLLNVDTQVDYQYPDEIAPGFEDLGSSSKGQLGASLVRVKLLMDEMMGPNTRQNLVDLIQQHLDGLNYPVAVDTKVARFPQPASAARRIAKLKESVRNDFKETMQSLFNKFCPDRCVLADFSLDAEPVNIEEAQYDTGGEYINDGELAIRISNISGTLLMDESLNPEERASILEVARLKTNNLKNVNLESLAMNFPNARGGEFNPETVRRLASAKESKEESTKSSTSKQDSSSSSSSTSKSQESRSEKLTRIERIERVEQSDEIRKELENYRNYGMAFGIAVLTLLMLIAIMTFSGGRGKSNDSSDSKISLFTSAGSPSFGQSADGTSDQDDKQRRLAVRYEIERLHEELTQTYAEYPRVAKHVFGRVLKEEGIETTAAYISLFGESIVVDLLKDASLQTDLHELTEFYATNTFELEDDEKLELIRTLYNRTIASKLSVLGNRSSTVFEFLAEMDQLQVLELIRNESITVKAVVLTQVDTSNRTAIFSKFDERTRMSLLQELSRIDYLPKAYIHNLAGALKRKRIENPRLNTESLPGSEVLVSLLERTGLDTQQRVITNLENSNPDNARTVKSKLVSIDTVKFLRDHQLLEVVLSLRHDELLHFLKGTSPDIRDTIFSKSPKDLVEELDEALDSISEISREGYQNIERKILNRIKTMADQGALNLIEVNERMFSEQSIGGGVMEAGAVGGTQSPDSEQTEGIKKVAGW